MPYGLVQTVAPAGEPVTLPEAKQWVRIDIDDDNALVEGLIMAARQQIEAITGRQLVTATWKLVLDRFPRFSRNAIYQQYADTVYDQIIPQSELAGRWWPDKASIRLPKNPVASITSINYIDGTGTAQVLDPATYVADLNTDPARVSPSYGNIWPIIRAQLGSVSVTFVAGYGNAAAVPDVLKVALKMLVAHWYVNREAVTPSTMAELPMAVQALLASYWNGTYMYT